MDTTRPSLLLRIRDRRDEAAWRAFDEIYRPMLFRYAKAQRLSDSDAEDVTQHCMSAITAKIAEFDYDPTKGRFKGWLRTLVNNRVRNLWRGKRERTAATGQLEVRPDPGDSPEGAFEKIWLEEHLWHVLRQLESEVDEVTYQAYVEHVIKQRPADQVCEDCEISRGNLHTIKWRMTQKVADRMRELIGDE